MDKSTVIAMMEAVFKFILLPLIAWGLNSFSSWIREKTANDTAHKYIDIASDTVKQAVNTVTQTYVDDLKAKGEFDANAQKEAFTRAFNTAKSLLTVKASEVLAEAYGDVDAWLQSKIESTIAEKKAA